jgi:hypothetical protein
MTAHLSDKYVGYPESSAEGIYLTDTAFSFAVAHAFGKVQHKGRA